MKKVVYIVLGLIVALGLFSGVGYLIKSNSSEKQEFLTRKPKIQDLEDKVVATGKIVPKEEIEIKPNISGIIQSIHVDEGDKVVAGQLIATIRIIPSVSDINSAQQEINSAQINLSNQEKQFAMQQRLFTQGVISRQEFLNSKQQYESAQQQLTAAKKRLQIVRTGSTPELQSLATTQVRAKSSGTVLEIPVKEGGQVIEANAFNPGTTICSIADLNSLIFEGSIDEAQAGKLKIGMEMNVVIGALQNKSFRGRLTLIAPKGKEENGTIKFPLEGDVFNETGEYIRAGFSANGEIVLSSVKKALLLEESLLQYEKSKNGDDKPYVEVLQPDGSFKKVFVKLGGSDGVNIQILSGIDRNSEIKVWNPSDKDKEELKAKKNK